MRGGRVEGPQEGLPRAGQGAGGEGEADYHQAAPAALEHRECTVRFALRTLHTRAAARAAAVLLQRRLAPNLVFPSSGRAGGRARGLRGELARGAVAPWDLAQFATASLSGSRARGRRASAYLAKFVRASVRLGEGARGEPGLSEDAAAVSSRAAPSPPQRSFSLRPSPSRSTTVC